ncbi:transposase [Saccharothrix longispora]|uniref:transposase n=1 Tax=Saccharothrix longispora TaxID=33920 RepID=UPI0028FD0DF4|nr:transposase [Saccharothrix longispora]MDU0294957.1 transposase [Saccharothrix longispora]
MSGKSKYPEQFRRDAVELARSSDRPLRQVARELGVNHETLRNWVRTAEQAQVAPPPVGGVSTDERQELRELRKRVAELEVEKDILRKAATYLHGRWVVDPQLPVHLRAPRRPRRRPAVQGPGRAASRLLRVARRRPDQAERAKADERLADQIAERHAGHPDVRGSSSRCAVADAG